MITSSYEGLLIASLVFATSRDQCVTSGLLSVLALGAEFELCYKSGVCLHALGTCPQ